MSLSGYTDPGNVDAGDTIDPAYGDQIRTNQNLFAGLFTSKSCVQVSSTLVSVDNSTTETTILSYTVPGGTLSTGNILKFQLVVRAYNFTGADKALDLTLKYGSTELITGVGGIDGVSGNRNTIFVIDGFLWANGATDAQIGMLNLPYIFGGMESPLWDFGSASEDSTGDLNLALTMQFSTASNDLEFHKYLSFIELMEA